MPAKVKDPKLSSLEEMSEHMMTHLPHLSWRTHCAGGKGKTIDYSCLGGVKDDKTRTVVVAKDRDTKMVMSSVVPVKGTRHKYPARRIRAFIDELGYERLDVVIKTDQEPGILDLAS